MAFRDGFHLVPAVSGVVLKMAIIIVPLTLPLLSQTAATELTAAGRFQTA